ncbi:glycoside hydrolase family 127 protein [Chiayiivirga flava]|uniref:Glycoside hydrolase family 127 protein n=1 Tax=Chiayiivirga flava TaxID=659595 RepID=A0A7W8G240_9GAMM|nr:beta-L-arabinofuranosidase domain-containing protein [Chiayiivirga flava]MBB5208295.1 hypothetical protein [Chiayiivirga flava]
MTAPRIQLRGLLGDALDANLRGRLSHFIVDETSPAIVLFAPDVRARNVEGDWYGEHAGKWLVAASKAAARSGDAALTASVHRVADYLVRVQEDDGYLGTYAPERRFMRPQPPKPVSWNGEPSVRTWDIWTHAYLVLGLIEAHRRFGGPRWLDAARRIGDLCCSVIGAHGLDITELGNHFGMSATVLMDPMVDLFEATGEPRYLALAQTIVAQADTQPNLALLTRALAGADASEIGTGKAYQLAWNLVGLAKLHRVTGEAAYRSAVEHLWRNIRDAHLSLGGGPWGGVAHRSREVFNPAGVFDPHGYVETCSTLAWIQLNRELLRLTGQAMYADEIERSAYNDLLGAQAPNGEDWCYYVFPNGRRVHTTYWRCCKSSGAMAIEELPEIAYACASDGTLTVNLLGPGSATFDTAAAGRVRIEQTTAYPADGEIDLHIDVERAATFALRVRIPAWADGATLQIDGQAADARIDAGQHAHIERRWSGGETVTLVLPMRPRTHRATQRNVQVSRAPDGSAVEQQVLRFDYLALSRGPLVYATGLVDGYKTSETVRPPPDADTALALLPSDDADDAPAIAFAPPGRAPLVFQPWYRAGGRVDGAWRLTWMALAPDDDAPP